MKRKEREEISSNQLLEILRAASNQQDSQAIENAITKINEGGKDLLMNFEDPGGLCLLSLAMDMDVPLEIMYKMIEIGGKDLVIMDYYGYTPLHHAFNEGGSMYQLVPKLLEVGGKDLVMKQQVDDGLTALHWACEVRPKENHDEAMAKLIEFGGKELVMEIDNYYLTALYYARKNSISLEMIKKMIDVGGKDLLEYKNYYGRLAVHEVALTQDRYDEDDINETLIFLIKEGIRHNIYGEFSFGGLFINGYTNDDDNIEPGGDGPLHEDWFVDEIWHSRILPVLLEVFRLINNESPDKTPPLLHSILMEMTPKRVILDLLDNCDSLVTIKDSLGRYAIDVAVQYGVPYDEGMKEVLEATAKANNGWDILHSAAHSAAHHGLPWDKGMQKLVSKNLDDALNKVDEKTGLKLFMTAAIGGDLDSIYSLVRMDPMSIY